jgi:3-oxoacyl-[acyl-carrier-protein] synthase III
MTGASITGWGSCMPPAVLSNDDLATFLDTSDEWIVTRTGMRERRISHVSATDMATLAARRALACAGLDGSEVELVVYGSVSNEEQCPNSASAVQYLLGAEKAAAMDLNTACTSFCYGVVAASAMIKDGIVKNAVVVGVELISRYMDWSNRNVAVLFGDGAAAVVLQAGDGTDGLLGSVLGCDADARATLRVRGFGTGYGNRGVTLGDTIWDFDGQQIFKRAVQGMSRASAQVMEKCGIAADEVDLVVPHQANLRIIESVARYSGIPMEKVMLTVEKYGNMSAATVPVALVEALEEGRVPPGGLVLIPAFGGGLTYCALLLRWGERTTPVSVLDEELPPLEETALEMVNRIRANQDPHGRSLAGLMEPVFPEAAAGTGA